MGGVGGGHRIGGNGKGEREVRSIIQKEEGMVVYRVNEQTQDKIDVNAGT